MDPSPKHSPNQYRRQQHAVFFLYKGKLVYSRPVSMRCFSSNLGLFFFLIKAIGDDKKHGQLWGINQLVTVCNEDFGADLLRPAFYSSLRDKATSVRFNKFIKICRCLDKFVTVLVPQMGIYTSYVLT